MQGAKPLPMAPSCLLFWSLMVTIAMLIGTASLDGFGPAIGQMITQPAESPSAQAARDEGGIVGKLIWNPFVMVRYYQPVASSTASLPASSNTTTTPDFVRHQLLSLFSRLTLLFLILFGITFKKSG